MVRPLVEIAVSNTWARIRTSDERVYQEIDELLSFFSKKAPYHRAYKTYKRDKDKARKEGREPRGWNGMVHLFQKKDHSFPAGLLPRVLHKLKYNEVKVADSRVAPAKHPRLTGGYVREELIDEKYAWQLDAFTEIEDGKYRGLFEAATGAGKTTLIARIVAHLGQPTLILVDRNTLIKQAVERLRGLVVFPNAKEDVFGMVGGGIWEPGLITVATYQTLREMLDTDETGTVKWLSQFTAMHVDEAHHVAAATYYTLTGATDDCYYRYGYSATPFKNDKETELRLVGMCGPVIFRYSPAEAMADKVISPAHVYVVDPEFPRLKPFDPIDESYTGGKGLFLDEYKAGIVEHIERNHLIANLAELCSEHKLPTLVFFRQKLQSHRLLMLIEDADMVDGHSSLAQRVDAKERLASGALPVLLASTIFNEGEDVPAIGAVIMGGGYRAEHLALQQLGRALRPSPGQDFILAFDVYDSHSQRLEKHSKSRIKAWREAGFEVHHVNLDELAELMDQDGFWG